MDGVSVLRGQKVELALQPPGHMGNFLPLVEMETLCFHFPEARQGVLPDSPSAWDKSVAASVSPSLNDAHTLHILPHFLLSQDMSRNNTVLAKKPRTRLWSASVSSSVK